jgi:hypothetical protein
MTNKTVTSTLAMVLSVACVGAQHARAQDAADPSSQVDSQPPADGQPPASDSPAPDDSASAPPAESTEPAADANPYEASADASMESSEASASETAAPPKDTGFLKLRWGAQLGYLFPTDSKDNFRAAKWMPIGAELGLGMGKSPFAIVVKADVSPLCFGQHDCSGMQVRGLAGLEVGIQKAPGSVLHMVYLNASLGFRYASSEIEDTMGSTENGKMDGTTQLVSECSAAMMIPVTHNFSIGPRVALSSALTGVTKEGVSSLQLGVRVLHAPGQ